MFRKFLIGVMVLGVGLVLWNEYRVWSGDARRHAQRLRERLHHPPSVNCEEPAPEPAPQEARRDEIHVIELSLRPWQTSEPPLADTEEPARLPVFAATKPTHAPAPPPSIVLAKFETRSPVPAIREEAFSVRGVWPWVILLPQRQQVSPTTDRAESSLEPEALFVMPRAIPEVK